MSQHANRTLSSSAAVVMCALLIYHGGGVCAQGGGSQPSAVHVDPVTEQEVQQRRMVTGDVVSVHRSDVAAREPGRVAELLVREGQPVKQGEALVRLNDDKLSIQLREVEAQIETAMAQIEERQANINRAERDRKLVQESFDRGAANPREVLNAESDLAVAQARLAQARQQVEVSRAQASLLRVRLRDMKITAPFDGYVITTSAEPGEWLREGDAVVELISRGAVEVWLNVPQQHLRDVRQAPGDATVGIDVNGVLYDAPFDRIIPQVDPRARRFTLIARIEDPDGMLAPGMSVTGWLPTSARARRLTVSKDAVLRNDAGSFVYVVREGTGDGPAQAAAVMVDVLYPIGTRYVIETDRLRAGDRVVVEGNERLFPQAPIKPVEADAGADAATDETAASTS